MSELKYFNPDTNYNRAFNNQEFIMQIITNIKNKLGRQLISTEKLFLIQLLKSINPIVFNTKTPEEISTLIENKVIEEISNQTCGIDDSINIHEMLKNEIGVTTEDGGGGDTTATGDVLATQATVSSGGGGDISGILGSKTLPEFARALNPKIMSKTIYIFLDTRYRILDDDGTKSFKWNFVTNATFTQGTVNVIGEIKDITKMKVFPVKIPYIPQADNNYNRITMFIQEFSAQAIIAQENSQFHFIFATQVQDRFIELNPKDNNNGIFEFKNPITHVETLTLSFGSPLAPIIFDTDRQIMSIASYGVVTGFTCPYPHNLATGDLVYVSNFITLNPYIDGITVAAINSTRGNTITYISDYIFTLDVDSSLILINGMGTLSINNGEQTVIGSGTNFMTLFSTGDVIVVSGFVGGAPTTTPYLIASIASDTVLYLQGFYNEDSNVGLYYQRNNTITTLQMPVYFGSKRIFIPMELHFNESATSN